MPETKEVNSNLKRDQESRIDLEGFLSSLSRGDADYYRSMLSEALALYPDAYLGRTKDGQIRVFVPDLSGKKLEHAENLRNKNTSRPQRNSSLPMTDNDYWKWVMNQEGFLNSGRREGNSGNGERAKKDMFEMLIKKYGGDTIKGVLWVNFEHEGEIKLWQEYAKLRDALFEDKELARSRKDRITGRIVGQRYVTDKASLQLEDAVYEVEVHVSSSKDKLPFGRGKLAVIKKDGKTFVRAAVSQIEKVGKEVGLKIQDAWKGLGMRRKWECGCEEYRNRRGEALLTYDCGEERGCAVRQYYQGLKTTDVEIKFFKFNNQQE